MGRAVVDQHPRAAALGDDGDVDLAAFLVDGGGGDLLFVQDQRLNPVEPGVRRLPQRRDRFGRRDPERDPPALAGAVPGVVGIGAVAVGQDDRHLLVAGLLVADRDEEIFVHRVVEGQALIGDGGIDVDDGALGHHDLAPATVEREPGFQRHVRAAAFLVRMRGDGKTADCAGAVQVGVVQPVLADEIGLLLA